MSYKVLFTKPADKDLQDAIEWYEAKRVLLGWEFRDAVSNTIDKIMNDLIDYQIYYGNIRKIGLGRFPYTIYYIKDVTTRRIVVIAVFHQRRNVQDIKSILR